MRQGVPDRRHHVRFEIRHDGLGGRAYRRSESRGFANAGLYDPPGVSGTHVMYVLHHADKPSLYAGLPDNPRISATVEFWKGLVKPLALAGIAAAAVSGFCIGLLPDRMKSSRKTKQRRSICLMPSARNATGDNRYITRMNRHDATQRNADPKHDRHAPQSLADGGVLRAADAVGPVDVPPAALLAVGAVRRRPMDTRNSSVDRHRSCDQLLRDDRAVLA